MVTRAVAAFAIVALLGAGVAPCAGWQPTPQAREDCCAKGHCPGELADGAGHPGSHSTNMSQAEADQCCATSEQKHQQGSAQFVDAAFVLLQPVGDLISPTIEVPLPDRAAPQFAPLHPPPTPLHVLFSVFLV